MLKRIWNKFIGIFRLNDRVIAGHVEQAVLIVNVLKGFLSNPALDYATSLTAFEADEKALKAIRETLPYVADVLGIVSKTDEPVEELLKKISEVLSVRHADFKRVFYKELALHLSVALSDGKLTVWEMAMLVQVIYRIKKEDNERTATN